MSAEEIRRIRELATTFAKEHCMHIVNQLEADSEKDEGKYGGGNFVAALEMFGALMVANTRSESFEQVDDATVDAHLDAILRASGSSLGNYSMTLTINRMRNAVRAAMGHATPLRN